MRVVEQRDDSTPLQPLVLALYDASAAMDELDESLVDAADKRQVELLKTYRMLRNQTIYADSYLQL